MRESGIAHDLFTFPTVNRAVSAVNGDATCAGMVHAVAMKMGFASDIYFCNTMIDAYCKVRMADCAAQVFDRMPHRDLVSWTIMISGWLSGGNAAAAIGFFNAMRFEFMPNSVTMITLLQGCCCLESWSLGRQLHGLVMKSGLLWDAFVRNSVLRMYARGGKFEEVELFSNELDEKDIVSVNILISFYSSQGDAERVAILFNDVQQRGPLEAETVCSVITSLANHGGNLTEGEKLHCLALKSGLCDFVLRTSLLDFYSKLGQLGYSVKIFAEIPHISSITWNAMMSSFIANGHFVEAIGVFHKMQSLGVEPGPEIFGSLIDACSYIGALQSGKEVHGYLNRNLMNLCWEEHTVQPLHASIINMYLRCGDISSAKLYFDILEVKDCITWSSMIEGYGAHGLGYEAVRHFHLMMEEGAEPNEVTFLSLLAACSHSGLVTEGCKLFSMMEWTFDIKPTLDHYTCLVDLLARSGRLEDAMAVITKMLLIPDGRIWGAIVAASRVHGDTRVGEFAARRLLELENDNAGYYTLLSNAQASIGNWSQVESLRQEMNGKDLKKRPGWSCFMDGGRMHGFVSGDRTHHEAEKIYELLHRLCRNIEEPPLCLLLH
ncbi:hypothetical protein SAY86_027916 [Trapa natans]|uniref:Pentatricopeptide repeat-containing protein n=1 Tax=Trapa natans TaxID=22666 RepID=A0AAN7RBQ0_TRANT|nr:hypothetical protein SAY86_027916 [Trapa natans]